jgi:uncharacterized membrane protein
MKNLIEHWNMSKYGKSRFKNDRSPLVDLIYVREVALAIDLISLCVAAYLWSILSYNFIAGLLVGSAVHFLIVSVLSITSTILERRWRRRLEAQKAFKHTLNKLALNKERRYDGRKVWFLTL